MNELYIRENSFCTLKPKNNNILSIIGSVGLATAILIIGAVTNGFINSVSGQKQQEFMANLSGSNETPPVKTTATGTVKFTAGTDGRSLAYVLNVTNINRVMGAHIHSAKQGENGPVIAGLFNPGMIGPPTGKVNGVLTKGNITSSDIQGTLPGKQISDLVNLMKSHGAYVDIHTQQHQNGEIRGQIGPIS